MNIRTWLSTGSMAVVGLCGVVGCSSAEHPTGDEVRDEGVRIRSDRYERENQNAHNHEVAPAKLPDKN